LSSSIIIRAENVIVTIFEKDSLKKITVESMITQPYNIKRIIRALCLIMYLTWYIDFQTQIKNVLVERDLPFSRVLYSGGNFMTDATFTSSSNTKENTGKLVYIVE
jgi:hypothetical protein